MKSFFISSAAMLLIHITSAQSIQTLTLNDFYREFRSTQIQQGNLYKEGEFQGSPHEKNEFTDGLVVTRANQRYENIPLRFNIFSNEMEFRTGEGTVLFMAAPEIIDHIMIDNNKYVYSPYSIGNRMHRGYFKVLLEGKATLLLKQNIIFKPAEPPQAYKESQPAKFQKMSDDFFIKIEPSEAKKVSKTNELVSLLNDPKNSTAAFIKKNKIKVNRADDLVKTVEYFNSLEQ
jgi:hypothetical protein